MGRPVLVTSMYLVLCCCFVYLSVTPHAVTAEDIGSKFYPVILEEVLMKMRQEELRQEQLRMLQNNQEHEMPQFTFQFPDDTKRNFQNDVFAVPPSDPRYYQPGADFIVADDKRSDSSNSYENVNRPDESGQVGTPVATEDDSWIEEVTTLSSEPEVKMAEDLSVFKKLLPKDEQDIVLVAIIAGCGAAAAAAVVALSVGWYKLHANSKAAADIEYPAYGVTGPNKEITPTGDRRLAQSAQMYHYQHQKQQIIAMESNRANNERRGSVSEGDSDEENEEGDYTVYECPGLAATGELEVRNPLFLDDPTPASGAQTAEEPPAPADKK